ncbi:hypothetical protein [Pseudomonas poae]|uniref:hypothetical protein n=1 Tax=Pseudomonas poae TaxID=200451 RepID=UPI0030D43EEA
MKVEFPKDVSSARHLDQSATAAVSAPAPAKVDELAQIFDREVLAGNAAMRATAIRIPPSEQLTQLYDQLGYPAQESLAAISRRFRHQLQHNVSVDKWVELAEGDPARAFVVLKHLEVQLDSEARPSEAAKARDAIALLSVGFKGEIQAGLAFAGTLLESGVIHKSARPCARSTMPASPHANRWPRSCRPCWGHTVAIRFPPGSAICAKPWLTTSRPWFHQ